MSNVRKQVFQIPTTSHMNAAPYQDGPAHQWLIDQLTRIAEAQRRPSDINQSGPTVTVIVEIIEGE